MGFLLTAADFKPEGACLAPKRFGHSGANPYRAEETVPLLGRRHIGQMVSRAPLKETYKEIERFLQDVCTQAQGGCEYPKQT